MSVSQVRHFINMLTNPFFPEEARRAVSKDERQAIRLSWIGES